jgi:hypothetical protein
LPPKIRIGKRINKSLDNTKSKLDKSLDNTRSKLDRSLDNTEAKVKKAIRKTDNTFEAITGGIRTAIRKGQNTRKTLETKADKTQAVIGRKYVKSAALIKKEADKGADAYDMLKKIVNDPNIKL